MKRILITALISAGLLATPACKGVPSGETDSKAKKSQVSTSEEVKGSKSEGSEEKATIATPKRTGISGSDPQGALALIPEGAYLALTLDLAALQNLPLFGTELIEQSILDSEDRVTYEAMKNCGITIDLMQRATMGAPDENGWVGILDGKGIAVKSKAECIAKWLLAEKGRKIAFTDGDGFTKMTGDDGRTAYLVGDDRLIFTDSGYASKIEAMLSGSGEKAIEGSLAAAAAIASWDRVITGLVGITSQQREKLAADMGALKDMTGAVIAAGPSGDGLKIDASVVMPDAAKATAAKDFMAQKYAEVKPFAAMLGIPESLANKVVFAANGGVSTVSLPLNAADIATIKQLAAAQAAQMGAAGGPPLPIPTVAGAPGIPPVGMPSPAVPVGQE